MKYRFALNNSHPGEPAWRIDMPDGTHRFAEVVLCMAKCWTVNEPVGPGRWKGWIETEGILDITQGKAVISEAPVRPLQ